MKEDGDRARRDLQLQGVSLSTLALWLGRVGAATATNIPAHITPEGWEVVNSGQRLYSSRWSADHHNTPVSRKANMPAEFKFDDAVRDALSATTKKVLIAFPEMLARQENMLREYHKDASAVLFERTALPLDNLKGSTRLIPTLYLTKTIYYSRSIIENVNSRNLLVAFQSMRALLEVVAAVRYTLEKMKPIIHECATRGTVTTKEAHQLNYHCDLLLHGGRFDWQAFFEEGAWAVLEKKNKPRTKEERKQFERTRYLKVDTCMKSWSKGQPLAGFAYDYLCDLVHPNKGSNLAVIVEREQGPMFDVDWPAALGFLIFDKIFSLVVKLCADEFCESVHCLCRPGS
jgi:hypothetical protein